MILIRRFSRAERRTLVRLVSTSRSSPTFPNHECRSSANQLILVHESINIPITTIVGAPDLSLASRSLQKMSHLAFKSPLYIVFAITPHRRFRMTLEQILPTTSPLDTLRANSLIRAFLPTPDRPTRSILFFVPLDPKTLRISEIQNLDQENEG
jgi:hypothetical protein